MNKRHAKQQANDDLDFLNDLGSSRSNFTEVNTSGKSIDDVVDNVISGFIERVKKNINDKGLNDTGQMQNIYMVKRGNEIEIMAPIHLIFQDKGVSGTENTYNTPFSYKDKMPPIDVIKQWVERKNLKSKNAGKLNGKESPFQKKSDSEIDSISFLIARNIQRKGIKSKNIYSKEIPKLVKELKKVIPNMMMKTFTDSLKKK